MTRSRGSSRPGPDRDRRRFLAAAAGILLGKGASVLLPPALWAAEPAPGRDPYIEEGRRRAIRAGCAYLAGAQNADGSFGGEPRAVIAISALSVLALLADGSTDGRGPHGEAVRRGIDFLVRLVAERDPSVRWHEGYFAHPRDHSSRMHGQGYATLALASALGTRTGDRYRQIRSVLEKAVACIEQAQTPTGGFGYLPVAATDHEGSVTVTVAQGLRAARDAGLLVSQDVVDRGLHYLKRSQNLGTRGEGEDGSFRYSVHVNQPSYALTAAAISSFFLYGRYVDDPGDDTIERGLDYLMRELSGALRRPRWYYYGHFYAAWACWQKDGDDWNARKGGYWARWHRMAYPDILALQRRTTGSWREEDTENDFGEVLTTAFSVLTLAIPDEGLPIFQR